jgi:hypothetical protein
MTATPAPAAVPELPQQEVRADSGRRMVLVFNRGQKITYYIVIDGASLTTCQMPSEQFERVYDHVPKRTDYSLYAPIDFAKAYTKDAAARAMIPISGSAFRVLKAIITGQPTETAADDDKLNQLEHSMAKAEAGEFRKPDGPVAQVHKYLDSRVDAIKAGTVSRKDLIDKMTDPAGKALSKGTVLTQTGIWARNNGVTFSRPAQAAEAKKAARSKSAKKAADPKPKRANKAASSEAAAAA